MTATQLYQDQDYLRAMQAEREAWLAVADKLPGTPGYDPELWAKWRAASRNSSISAGARFREEQGISQF
jgi:hypothetical protein